MAARREWAKKANAHCGDEEGGTDKAMHFDPRLNTEEIQSDPKWQHYGNTISFSMYIVLIINSCYITITCYICLLCYFDIHHYRYISYLYTLVIFCILKVDFPTQLLKKSLNFRRLKWLCLRILGLDLTVGLLREAVWF